jgi:hypothetical protein
VLCGRTAIMLQRYITVFDPLCSSIWDMAGRRLLLYTVYYSMEMVDTKTSLDASHEPPD